MRNLLTSLGIRKQTVRKWLESLRRGTEWSGGQRREWAGEPFRPVPARPVNAFALVLLVRVSCRYPATLRRNGPGADRTGYLVILSRAYPSFHSSLRSLSLLSWGIGEPLCVSGAGGLLPWSCSPCPSAAVPSRSLAQLCKDCVPLGCPFPCARPPGGL
jgi:hypothetical protein